MCWVGMANTFLSCAVSGWLGACGGGVGPEGERALIEWGPWWHQRGWWQGHQGFCTSVGRCKVSAEKKKASCGQSGKKRKYIRGNREDDWLLRRSRVLPFWRSPYTPPRKSSLKGWSRSRRSGVWWSCSFKKTSTSGTTDAVWATGSASQISVI